MASKTANRGRRLILGATVVVIAVGLAVAGAWHFLLRDSNAFRYVIGYEPPAPVSLAAALEAVTATPGVDGALPGNDLSGTWTILRGESSFAGYRVQETLASFGTNTAVGRTTDLEGSLEFDGAAITAVDVTAGLQALTSDQSERDEQLHSQALETDAYPTARFVLTEPVRIEAVPADGETVAQAVSGELTLHGVTRAVELDVEATLHRGLLIVVGSAEIRFVDYEIEEPSSFTVLSTEDHGILELQLVFARP